MLELSATRDPTTKSCQVWHSPIWQIRYGRTESAEQCEALRTLIRALQCTVWFWATAQPYSSHGAHIPDNNFFLCQDCASQCPIWWIRFRLWQTQFHLSGCGILKNPTLTRSSFHHIDNIKMKNVSKYEHNFKCSSSQKFCNFSMKSWTPHALFLIKL